MKRFLWLFVVIFAALAANPVLAETRMIVRETVSSAVLNSACTLLLGCTVERGLGDPNGQLFLVGFPSSVSPALATAELLGVTGVTAVEVDQLVKVQNEATVGTIPDALYDSTPMNYYGATVRHGYVYQTPNQIVRTLETQQYFSIAGTGTIAVIDTGIDTTHPALQAVVTAGYDFVHNTNNPDEKQDLGSSVTISQGDTGQPGQVSQSAEAVLDQSAEAVLDGDPQYADFGHGTMTSGVVHLVAPLAQIMPLKAFSSDGTGYASDVLRAIYYAIDHGAEILNMSFSFTQSSPELKRAIDVANMSGLICVAAAGNDGLETMVYPAGLNNEVMGIASTNNYDVRSDFSNYGSSLVWVAAPGEGIVTTYPFGHYAAAWGTSFSTPFVSGTAALLLSVSPSADQSMAQSAISNAKTLDPGLHYGRLDIYQAVNSLW
jgi:subtilisin family serine protease